VIVGYGTTVLGDEAFRWTQATGLVGLGYLPGGDDAQMVTSLTRLFHEIPHDIRVLPGHGPETRIGNEAPWLERLATSGQLVIPG
jgi:glyoxylase-like metal-dependent hydrolase (beta-lactamase superfamily II)